jgi:hypothetical protein
MSQTEELYQLRTEAENKYHEGDIVQSLAKPYPRVVFGAKGKNHFRLNSSGEFYLIDSDNYAHLLFDGQHWAARKGNTMPETEDQAIGGSFVVKHSPEKIVKNYSKRAINLFIENHKSELSIYDISQLMNSETLTEAMRYLMIRNKNVTKEEMPPYTKPTQKQNGMKFKNFKWKETDKISLEDYIKELGNHGWKAMGSTKVPNKKKKTIIIHCIWEQI